MTAFETEQAFLMFIRECAIDTNDPIIGDGALHRFHIIGDKKGTKNGAYLLHVDGIANGFVKNHKTGQRHNWVALNKRSESPTIFFQKPLLLWLEGT